MQKFAYSIKKPDLSITSISKFLSNLSKLLKENKIIKNQVSTSDCESLIKKNFTQCWNYFIVFQIQFLTEFKKKFFGDFETLSIWSMIFYNQNLSYFQKLQVNEYLLLTDWIKKGKIIKIWKNVRVKDHAKEVLDFLKNI